MTRWCDEIRRGGKGNEEMGIEIITRNVTETNYLLIEVGAGVVMDDGCSGMCGEQLTPEFTVNALREFTNIRRQNFAK